MSLAPVPAPIQPLVAQCTHPGLLLDKYAPSWEQGAQPGKLSERVQRPTLEGVVRAAQAPPPDGLPFPELVARHNWLLKAADAVIVRAVTAGPFTLHLARASALENAGICLHPVHGFPFLPGSGVKGLTHAYACEYWLPAQADRAQAWATICRVFGTAPAPWLNDLARRHDVKAPEEAVAGAVVFHDAWPEAWPGLSLDILNSHHAEYYQEKGAPGDWGSPIPVYFLSVPGGKPFTFAVAARRAGDAALARQAAEWLAAALPTLGAGAKTNSGYGHFGAVTLDGVAAPPVPVFAHRPEQSATLELVAPAFLAGAMQESPADCVLRPATLRGLLRWWWRTLHAGHVDVRTLRQLESAVWGNTTAGAAVRLTVAPVGEVSAKPFDREAVRRQNQVPTPAGNKTSPGLTYHSYGTDEINQGTRKRRFYLPAGTRWVVKLSARAVKRKLGDKQPEVLIPAEVVLDQARAALWLLTRLGGAGAKSRKGFGSFADPPELAGLDRDACLAAAARFRAAWGLGQTAFDARKAESPALEQALALDDLELTWGNPWLALDALGASAQNFAQRYKHQREKCALGLPRRIGAPASGQFRPGPAVQKSDRHASPVVYHLGRGPRGLVVRVTAFPAAQLPDLATSQAFLAQLLDHLRADLPGRLADRAAAGARPAVNPGGAPPPPPGGGQPAQAARPASGARVEAELLAEKTKNGGWKAKHPGTGLVGPVVNTTAVPADKKPGDLVTLVVASISATAISFTWPAAPPPPATGGGVGGGKKKK